MTHECGGFNLEPVEGRASMTHECGGFNLEPVQGFMVACRAG